ncbi:MAG TPA: phage ORF5 protein [Patescibacteria group bacterium]|nr:MAG: nonstructural protein [Microviridae sp.]HUD20443.1 phage ORF5 protein [Patescibacteria group bacterium]
MRTNLYSVKDVKANFYFPPFNVRGHVDAVRHFSFSLSDNKVQTQLNLYPADFDLYHVGYFDDDTATLVPIPAELVVQGVNINLGAIRGGVSRDGAQSGQRPEKG